MSRDQSSFTATKSKETRNKILVQENTEVSYQKYAMYIESNANLLINGYLPHTTDLMV